jgi:hypothetical protein
MILYRERDCAILPIQVVTLFVVASRNAVTNYLCISSCCQDPIHFTSTHILSQRCAIHRYCSVSLREYIIRLFSIEKGLPCRKRLLAHAVLVKSLRNSLASSLENTNQLTVAQLWTLTRLRDGLHRQGHLCASASAESCYTTRSEHHLTAPNSLSDFWTCPENFDLWCMTISSLKGVSPPSHYATRLETKGEGSWSGPL